MSVSTLVGHATRLKGVQMKSAQSATAMIGAVLCMTLVASGCSNSVEATDDLPQATTDSPDMGSPDDYNGDLLPPGELATTSADGPKGQGEDPPIGPGALPAPQPDHEPRPAPKTALQPAPPSAAAFPLPDLPQNTDLDPPMGMTAVRDSYTGPCPPPAGEAPYFQALIGVEAGPTTVRYRWQDSNGGSPDTDWKTIEFVDTEQQDQIVDYTVTHYPSGQTAQAWVAIEVESVWKSERVPYTITCVG